MSDKVKEGYKKFLGPLDIDIPNNWDTFTFQKATSLTTDYVANGSFASLSENVDYKDEEDYAILLRLVDNSNKFKGPFVYIDRNAYNFLSKTKLNPGDIILSNIGARLGTVFRVPNLNKPMNLGPNAILIRAKKSDDYIYYWLESEFGQKIIKSITTVTAQPKFNKTDLRNSLIPLPPLPEQQRIADILSSVDTAIEKTVAIIDKTKELKQGLMQELLTKGIGHNEFKEVRIGVKKYKIPQKWEVNKLQNCCEVCYGKSQNDVLDEKGKYPILGTGGLIGYANNYLFNKPSVLIGRKGTIDKPQFINKPFWTIDTLFYTKIYENTEPKWLYYYLNYYDLSLLNEATGVPSLNRKNLYNLDIPVPPLAEQQKIASILSSVDNKIQKKIEQKQKLEELKKGLMQQLLTGQKRVKVSN